MVGNVTKTPVDDDDASPLTIEAAVAWNVGSIWVTPVEVIATPRLFANCILPSEINVRTFSTLSHCSRFYCLICQLSSKKSAATMRPGLSRVGGAVMSTTAQSTATL